MTAPDAVGSSPAVGAADQPAVTAAVGRTGPPGRRRAILWGAVGVAVAMVAFVAVLATRPPAASTEADSPLLGHSAPPIAGARLAGDGEITLASLRGHFVLVNFFASWCGPCHVEQPSLVELSRSIDILGVAYTDSSSAAESFLVSSGAHWPAVNDSSGAISVLYGVRAPPESYLVSPDGTVEAKVLGAITSSQVSYLKGVMARVLATGQ